MCKTKDGIVEVEMPLSCKTCNFCGVAGTTRICTLRFAEYKYCVVRDSYENDKRASICPIKRKK